MYLFSTGKLNISKTRLEFAEYNKYFYKQCRTYFFQYFLSLSLYSPVSLFPSFPAIVFFSIFPTFLNFPIVLYFKCAPHWKAMTFNILSNSLTYAPISDILKNVRKYRLLIKIKLIISLKFELKQQKPKIQVIIA